MITEMMSALSFIGMLLSGKDVWCLLSFIVMLVSGKDVWCLLSFIVMLVSGKDVWCLLSVILTVPGLLAPLGVCGAPLQCPPGGRYFDKNLGQWGRFACCSELCEPPGFFMDQCSKKCPNYEKDKYVDDSPADNDKTNPSTLVLYILIPVAVLLLLLVLVVRIRRVRDRGWRGLLPAIFPQRAAPGVQYYDGNVVLPGDTPPPRTPAEDGDVGQNPLDDPQPEDDEVGRKLLADPQLQERLGGACGGPAQDGEFCQTAKEDAPPIQAQDQDQEADQAVEIYGTSLPARHCP